MACATCPHTHKWLRKSNQAHAEIHSKQSTNIPKTVHQGKSKNNPESPKIILSMSSKDFCNYESPKIILSMSSKDFCDQESPKIILSMSSKDFCNSCNSNWIQNDIMQSSDLKVSIIRSDYPSNAQGNDQREFSASCLRHLKTFLYPDDFTSLSKLQDDFTSRSSYPKISKVHSCSRLFLFPQGRSGDKISVASTPSIT